MFNFNRTTNGVLQDNRSLSDKLLDYKHGELAMASSIVLQAKPESDWRKYPIRNQKQTGSCVAHAVVKAMGINNYLEEGKFLELSPRYIYANRPNQGEGMYGLDAMKLACNIGAPLEIQVPFVNSETGMSNIDDATEYDKQSALIVKEKNFIFFDDIYDIDTIAKYIETSQKGIVLFFRFNSSEWNTVPKIKDGVTANSYHAVCGTNGILYNGDTAIVVEDSWGISFGFSGRRIITREWFEKGRCTFASYFMNLNNNWRDSGIVIDKPIHQFNINMMVGDNSSEVKALQECLASISMFPQDQTCTGYYGGITASAVLEFQRKFIGSTTEIESLKGTRCGPQTRTALNNIFK